MVTGGVNPWGAAVSTTELISTDSKADPVPECKRRLANFPHPTSGHAAMTIGPGVFVCGGHRHFLPGTDARPVMCFVLKGGAKEWVPAGNMSYSRWGGRIVCERKIISRLGF